MEYMFSLIDENVNLPIVEDASANSNGMNTILKSVCGMNQFARRLFMTELNKTGFAEIIAGKDDEFPITIFAKNLEVGGYSEMGSKAYLGYLERKIDSDKPTAFFT